MEQKKKIIIRLLIGLVVLLTIGSLYFVTPFNGDLNMIDEGQFAAWVSKMLAGGHMFKDIYITYGPFYVYPLYFIFKIFGPNAFIIRFLYSVVTSLLSLWFILLLISKLKLNKSIEWILFAIILLFPGLGLRQGIIYFVIYLLLCYFENKSQIISFLIGVFSITAFLISPESGIFLFILASLFYLFSFIFDKNAKIVIKQFLWFILGLSCIAMIFYVLSSREGWFGDYVINTLDVLSSFSGINLPNGQAVPNLLPIIQTSQLNVVENLRVIFSKDALFYWEFLFYVITFFVLLIKVLKRNFFIREFAILSISLYGLFAYFSLIGRGANFFLVLTPILLIGSCCIDELVNFYKKNKISTQQRAALILIIVLLSFFIRVSLIFRTNLSNLPLLFNEFTKDDNPPFVGPIHLSDSQKKYIENVQQFVWENTGINDYVFFLSDEPMMYMLIQRQNPVRFDVPFIANSKNKRYEVLNDLIKKEPKYIFYNQATWPVDGIDNKRRLPEVTDLVSKNYKKIKSPIPNIEIYELKSRI